MAPGWGNTAPLVPSKSVEIRLRKWERVLDQFKPWFRVVCNDYFHNIEPEKNIGIVEHPQPSQSAARNAFLFLSIDGCNRPAEVFPRARLYFDEYERVVIATDNVDLAAAASLEVTVKNLVPVTPQESTRQLLAVRAAPEMDRFPRVPQEREVVAPPVRKIGDGSGKVRIHGA